MVPRDPLPRTELSLPLSLSLCCCSCSPPLLSLCPSPFYCVRSPTVLSLLRLLRETGKGALVGTLQHYVRVCASYHVYAAHGPQPQLPRPARPLSAPCRALNAPPRRRKLRRTRARTGPRRWCRWRRPRTRRPTSSSSGWRSVAPPAPN